MKITLLQVRNFRALEHADVRPGDRNLLIIGGKNRSGKTSLLSALETAFGGAREQPPEPVRHGSRRATIHVELDDGDLVIDRIIDREGRHKLEVHTKEGKQNGPQKMLDQLIGARFLDPLHFLRLNPKAQRDLLVQVADIDVDLEALAADRTRDYDERRNVNRDLKRAQGAAEQLGDEEQVPTVTPTAEVLADLAEKRTQLAERNRARERCAILAVECMKNRRAIKTLDEERAALVKEGEQIELEVTEQREAFETSPTAEQISKELEELTERATAIAEDAGKAAAIEERNTRRKEARGDVERLEGMSAGLTTLIEGRDKTKADALARAKMPIPGLEIDDERVIYNGAPFEQAADSERLHASLAIAAALSKEIRDVWVRDGSLLDRDSLAEIEKFAEESGYRVWVERVGEDDTDALIIQEGELREQDAGDLMSVDAAAEDES